MFPLSWSASAVNIMGSEAVPTAEILPPRATIRALASPSIPGFPLIIVPASMVRVWSLLTNTRPFNTHTLLLVHVMVPVPCPRSVTVTSPFASSYFVAFESGSGSGSFSQATSPKRNNTLITIK